MAGQADDLGGGVLKQRLSDNQYCSIILARGREFWVYQYLFAKQDRANFEDDELKAFRELAKGYAALTAEQVTAPIAGKDWIEICTDQGFRQAGGTMMSKQAYKSDAFEAIGPVIRIHTSRTSA